MTIIFAGTLVAAEILPFARVIEMRMQALTRLRAEPGFRSLVAADKQTTPEAVDKLLVANAARHPLSVLRDLFQRS